MLAEFLEHLLSISWQIEEISSECAHFAVPGSNEAPRCNLPVRPCYLHGQLVQNMQWGRCHFAAGGPAEKRPATVLAGDCNGKPAGPGSPLPNVQSCVPER